MLCYAILYLQHAPEVTRRRREVEGVEAALVVREDDAGRRGAWEKGFEVGYFGGGSKPKTSRNFLLHPKYPALLSFALLWDVPGSFCSDSTHLKTIL